MILYPRAKINLSLYITGKRPDGYHTIDTVFQPLTLCDRLCLEEAREDLFSCSDPALETPENLVITAVRRLRGCVAFPPAAASLEKHIPSQAGLGGGSADAAAVLAGLNELYSLGLDRPELEQIGAEIGADVPALLHQGPTRGRKTGTLLTALASRSQMFFLIVKPSVSCPTAAMYRSWDEKGGTSVSLSEIESRQKALEAALAAGDVRTVAGLLHNDFESVLSGEAADAFDRIRQALQKAGAAGTGLCGSGSAVYGLFETSEKRDAACEALRSVFPADWRLYPCESLREDPVPCSVILAAGGSGSRFGGETNKIFAELGGGSVFAHSLRVFLRHPDVRQIIIPCRAQDRDRIRKIAGQEAAELEAQRTIPEILFCEGGRQRQDSVRNALALCREETVLIHDAARPYVKPEAVDACLEGLRDYPAVSLAVLSRDTVKITNERGEVCETTDRARTWLVQTPQGFRTDLLRRAHVSGKKISVTDDCALMEEAGYKVRMIPGDYTNIKITFPSDLPQRFTEEAGNGRRSSGS